MDRWTDEGGGHLRHGDLHRLQHLLHRLHGALVLLGAATSQLHVGRDEKNKRSGIKVAPRDHHVSFKPGQPKALVCQKNKNILSRFKETEH